MKFGITMLRSVGTAVHRNRLKRVMRETFRCNRDKFPGSGRMLFVISDDLDETVLISETFNLISELFRRGISPGGKLNVAER